MFTASLTPRHNVANLVNALEALLDIPVTLLGRHKVFSTEDIGAILKVAEPNFALCFEEHYVNFVQNSTGMWGLEVVDRFSGQRNFYLGAGYRKGILSGNKPLSEWGKDPEGFYYFIENCSDKALEQFNSATEISYSAMADRMACFNKKGE